MVSRVHGLQVQLAHFGDEEGVVQGFGDFAEEFGHFGAGFQVVALVAHAHPGGVPEGLPRLHAEEDVVIAGVLPSDVVDVVGGHEGDAVFAAEFDELAVEFFEPGDAVVLEFEEEGVGAEDVPIPVDGFDGFPFLALFEEAGDFRGRAPAGGDEPFRVPGEEFLVHPGLVVEALELGRGGDFHEVEVARAVARQEEDVVGLCVELGVPILHAAGGQVALHADDGLDAGLCRGPVEVDDAVHDAVVGEGKGGLPQFHGASHQLWDPAQTVKQGIFRMYVQVNERVFLHRCGALSIGSSDDG